MDFNCLKEGAQPDWERYCHFYVVPGEATKLPEGDIGFSDVLLESVEAGRVDIWTLFGLTSDGESELIHDAATRGEASAMTEHCFRHLNRARSHKIMANEFRAHFTFGSKFDFEDFDDIESRPVKFYVNEGCWEQCEKDDSPTAWAVYGHMKDPEVGGCMHIHDCATEAEMKQVETNLSLEMLQK